MLDSIAVVKKTVVAVAETEKPNLTGLRDRALIRVMTYTFARVNAVVVFP